MLQLASASPLAPTMWAVTCIRERDPVRFRAVSEGRRAGGATHSHGHVSHTAGTGETGEKRPVPHALPVRDRLLAGNPVSYTHLRAHETRHDLVCRLLLEK